MIAEKWQQSLFMRLEPLRQPADQYRLRPGRRRHRQPACRTAASAQEEMPASARPAATWSTPRSAPTPAAGFPDGFVGVGLHHQGPICLPYNMNDWRARIDSEEAAIERPTPTPRRLVRGLRQSEHPTDLRRHVPAARRLARRTRARRRGPRGASNLAELPDAERASWSASMAVAAACFRAKLARQPTAAGERTARVLAGYRRTAGDRGRGQGAAVRGSRIWPPCSPPATGRGGAGAVSSPTRSPSIVGVSMRCSRGCCSWPECGAAK